MQSDGTRSIFIGSKFHYTEISINGKNLKPWMNPGRQGFVSGRKNKPLSALIDVKDPLLVFVLFIALEINLDQLDSVRIFKIRIYQS